MNFHEDPYHWLIHSGVFDNAAVLLINEDGHVVDNNALANEWLNCTSTLLGRDIRDFMAEDERDNHTHHIQYIFSKPIGYLQQLGKPTPVNTCNGESIEFKVHVIRLTESDRQTAAVLLLKPDNPYSLMERLFISELRFQSALKHLPVPAAINDAKGDISFLNDAFIETFGYRKHDIPTLEHWWQQAYPDAEYRKIVIAEWTKRLNKAIRENAPFEPYEVIVKNGFGEKRLVLAQVASLEGDLSQEHLVLLQDITDIRNTEMSIKFQADVLHNLREGIHLVSTNSMEIAFSNDRMEELFGYEHGEMVGLHVSLLNSGSEAEQRKMAESILENLQNRGFWEGDVCNRKKDGTEFWSFARIKKVLHPDYGECWVSIHQDITEQKQFHQMIWRQAHYDPLTNLPNRRLLEENIEQEISDSQRSDSSFALMFLDIDNFKEINDLFGHQTGDALLIELGSRLEQSIRKSDFVSRFGGDEYVILVRNIQKERVGELQILAEKIADGISAPYYIAPETISITVSIGISIYPMDGNTSSELLSFSDQALYESKSRGKNQIRFFTENLQHVASRNRQLAEGLKQALKKGQFDVFYQPIVRTDNGVCMKAEALLRWKSNGNYISPELFIPIAEDTGLIHEIGHFVFERVLKDLASLKSSGYEQIQLSLNKSVLQMSSDRISTEKIWPFLVQEKGLSPQQLCIELTESAELTSSNLINRKFTRLRQAGFDFAIDDFGTGYTSLDHMASYPFQFTKIDRSFITDIETDPHRRDLIEGMIALSQKLKMKVIAEGVERAEQAEILDEFGCDFLQGYWIAKPMPFNEFLHWLKKNNSNSEQ